MTTVTPTMQPSWASFEDKVRAVASAIWNGNCSPANIGGVDLDGVIILSDDAQIFIEMTEERDVNKVRTDVIKLQTARTAYLQENQSYPRCYCVVNGSITRAMRDAGAPHRINVLSFAEFSAIFFDFDKYKFAREQAAFGSAINTLTGTKDDRQYIPVTYLMNGTSKVLGLSDIAGLLNDGRRLVLLDEYGTGKSRCYGELFKYLASNASNRSLYPIALNLREYWGLRRAPELIARHVAELGLDQTLQNAATRAFSSQRVILLLDGFDELGSQSWSNDSEKMRAIRAKSLEGIKDLLTRSHAGALISGREHYFNSNLEMFAALGLEPTKTIILRCKNEFSEQEMRDFFANIEGDIGLPDWLPRRPLICQTIVDMEADDLDQMFGVGQDELSFWDHFISVLCEREARIHVSFDAKTIQTVLAFLARLTRTRPTNVGPITLADVHAAFESAVGQMPVEEASVMLQRLPALGRVAAESNDRQFIDTYILDGLRAKDAGMLLQSAENKVASVLENRFINPLESLGQRILARDIEAKPKQALEIAKRSASAPNRVIGSDIVASFLQTALGLFDFERLTIQDGTFIKLDMSSVIAQNLTITDSTIGTLVLPTSVPPNTSIRNCIAERVALRPIFGSPAGRVFRLFHDGGLVAPW